MCKGQCPGTSIDGDWRNRTEHCDLWKGLFRTLEEQMLDAGEVPLSASPERKAIEGAFLELWAQGQSTSIAGVKRWMAERAENGGAARRRRQRPRRRPTRRRAARRRLSRRSERAQVTDIQRLDFTLPDFTRLAWVSDHAKEVWQPRLSRITTAWLEIEWRAVLAGVRRCALTMVSPEEFMDQGAVWAGKG